MKLHLYSMGKNKNINENLGTERLYTYLNKRNHEVDYFYLIEQNDFELTKEKILDSDIAGFSLYPDTINFAQKCMSYAKNAGKIVIAGSKYSTDYAEQLLKNNNFIDAIFLGHAEFALEDFLNKLNMGLEVSEITKENEYIMGREDISTKKIKNINITKLDLPDRTKFIELVKPREVFICDSHGCVGSCSFCSNCHNMKKYTTRTPEDILFEISNIQCKYDIKSFFLCGNSFDDPGTLGKSKIEHFCELLLKKDEKYSLGCYIRANFIKSEQDKLLLKKMVDCGFDYFFIGIESGNQQDLDLYNKKIKVDDSIRLLQYMKTFKESAFASYGFIMFNPFSTTDRLKENYEFLLKLKCPFLDSFISKLFIFYSTKMYETCKREGVLNPGYSYNDISSYSYKYSEVDRIWKFIEKYILPFRKQLHNINDIIRHFYSFRDKTNIQYSEKFQIILDNIAEVLSEYFFMLYIENNISKCIEEVEFFKKNINELYNELSLINIKTVKNSIYKKEK